MTEYLWVQFLDGVIAAGRPCPRCQGTDLRQWREYFVRCHTCNALLVLQSRPDGVPDKHQVARLEEFRFLSDLGQAVDEVPHGAGVLVDARCHFFRPVPGLHLRLVIYAGQHMFLRADLPLTLAVPEPQTVAITVGVPPGLLNPGFYNVQPWVRYSLDERSFVSLPRPDPLQLVVTDEAAEAAEAPSKLQWSVRSAHDGKPLPLAAPSTADDEAEEE